MRALFNRPHRPPAIAGASLLPFRGSTARVLLSWASCRLASRRGRLGAIAALVVSLLLASALSPHPAYGFCTSIGGCVDGAMQKIFGVEGDWVSGTFIQWLIDIKSPGLTSGAVGSALYDTTQDFAFAALLAILTLSAIHYWVAGVAMQGAGAGIALEGLFRTGGAALFILAWPWLIDSSVDLAGILKDELIPGAKLDAINATLVAVTPWNIVGIVVVTTYALLGLVLYVIKVMLTAGLLVTAGGMPLALAVWPIPGLSVFASGMLKWCAGIASVEIAWAVEVFAYSWIGGSDWLTFSGDDSFLAKLGAPITMIALLALMVMTPSSMLKLVGLGGGGNFFAFLAARFVERGAATRIPRSLGGTKGGGPSSGHRPPPSPEQPLPRQSSAGNRTKGDAGSEAPGNQTPNATSTEPTTRQTTEPSPSTTPDEPYTSADGLPHQGSGDGYATARNEVVQKRTNGVDSSGAPAGSAATGRRLDAADVRQALSSLHASGLGQPAADHIQRYGERRWDTHVANRFADSAAGRGLSAQQRDAFTTLGGAEHGERIQGAKTWKPPAPAAPSSPPAPSSQTPPPASTAPRANPPSPPSPAPPPTPTSSS